MIFCLDSMQVANIEGENSGWQSWYRCALDQIFLSPERKKSVNCEVVVVLAACRTEFQRNYGDSFVTAGRQTSICFILGEDNYTYSQTPNRTLFDEQRSGRVSKHHHATCKVAQGNESETCRVGCK